MRRPYRYVLFTMLLATNLVASEPSWSPIACPDRIEDLIHAYPASADAPIADWSQGLGAWTLIRGDQQAKGTLTTTNGPHGPQLELAYRFSGTMGHHDYLEIDSGGVEVPRPGLGISFLLQLNGHKPMGVCVRVIDAGGETWQQDVACQSEGDWLRCVAVFDRWPGSVWGGDSNRHLDYPIRLQTIIIDRAKYGDDSHGMLHLAKAHWVTLPAPSLRIELVNQRLGNLYHPDEPLRIRATGQGARIRWSIKDFTDTVLAAGEGDGSGTEVMQQTPGVGWYRLGFELLDSDHHVREVSDFNFAVLHPDQSKIACESLGVNTHFGEQWWAPLTVMSLLPQYGFKHLRDQFSWAEVEAKKGDSQPTAHHRLMGEAAKANGLQALMIACYLNGQYRDGGYPDDDESLAAFGLYARRMAETFPGTLSGIEVWNEYWGGIGVDSSKHPQRSPEQYGRMMEAVRQAVKAYDKKIPIMGLGGEWHMFLSAAEKMMAATPAAYDGYTIHPYHDAKLIEESDPKQVSIYRVARDFIDAAKRTKVEGPLWVTEYGWSNDLKAGRKEYDVWTQAEQAVCDLRATALLHAAGAERVYTYEFLDQSIEPMADKFGLVLPVAYNCAPKPVAVALATYARLTAGRGRPEYLHQGDLHAVCFPGPTTSDTLWLLWTTGSAKSLTMTGQVLKQTTMMGAELPTKTPVTIATNPLWISGKNLKPW